MNKPAAFAVSIREERGGADGELSSAELLATSAVASAVGGWPGLRVSLGGDMEEVSAARASSTAALGDQDWVHPCHLS